MYVICKSCLVSTLENLAKIWNLCENRVQSTFINEIFELPSTNRNLQGASPRGLFQIFIEVRAGWGLNASNRGREPKWILNMLVACFHPLRGGIIVHFILCLSCNLSGCLCACRLATGIFVLNVNHCVLLWEPVLSVWKHMGSQILSKSPHTDAVGLVWFVLYLTGKFCTLEASFR